MTKQGIIDAVKQLKLPDGSYVVFGSCPMAVAGIRQSNDVDLLVTKELSIALKQAGWERVDKGVNDKPYKLGVFEAHTSWDFSSYSPSLNQLLKTATVIESVPFASLHEVRKWKFASGRPKDLVDIELIDRYLEAIIT